jgi:hypothetical protein
MSIIERIGNTKIYYSFILPVRAISESGLGCLYLHFLHLEKDFRPAYYSGPFHYTL